ncbi:putative nucleotidyltransferase [Candidatus Desulfarcum epimagneticum]|uniref:Putative nucleotidyltransferase n=1 Tax=uncultured Desulfobacteraceae bacterium TaxID=218296 RepID=A0A484HCE4_9BACT|nr:putative nucleotidyltransferase [uncultured Desulfobacteraceae bacterium]
MGEIEAIRNRRNDIIEISRRRGATNIRVIGSTARGESGQSSDFDFLVDLEPGRSLLDHASLVLDLEKLLGRKVDIAVSSGLRQKVKERVLKEAVPL